MDGEGLQCLGYSVASLALLKAFENTYGGHGGPSAEEHEATQALNFPFSLTHLACNRD